MSQKQMFLAHCWALEGLVNAPSSSPKVADERPPAYNPCESCWAGRLQSISTFESSIMPFRVESEDLLRSSLTSQGLPPITFWASINSRDPILSLAASAAFKLMPKRTLLSSRRKQIIPPALRKSGVSPTVKTGAFRRSASSTGITLLWALPIKRRWHPCRSGGCLR